MSLHFILDGYNIIKKIPQLSSKELKDAREAFIQLIEEKRLTGSKKNKVTVVFDGSVNDFTFKRKSPFEIIFAEDADRKIKDMTEKLTNLKNTVVVTDDREIKFFVQSKGCKVLDTESFLEKMKKRYHSKEDLKLAISSEEQAKITEELKNLWLK